MQLRTELLLVILQLCMALLFLQLHPNCQLCKGRYSCSCVWLLLIMQLSTALLIMQRRTK